MKQIITGMDLGKLLLEAGLIPPNSGDVIIECPVDGPVILHCIAFGDERMLAVFSGQGCENRNEKEAEGGFTEGCDPLSKHLTKDSKGKPNGYVLEIWSALVNPELRPDQVYLTAVAPHARLRGNVE